MLIGYARVSTQDQNLDLQREALNQAGCKAVFEDKISGTRAEWPALIKVLEMLREGDTDYLAGEIIDIGGGRHSHLSALLL